MKTQKKLPPLSVSLSPKVISKLAKRFHLIIFFVIISGCIVGAILYANLSLNEASNDESYVSPISAGSIDEETLQRVQSLHTSDSSSSPELPPGRVNPFGE